MSAIEPADSPDSAADSEYFQAIEERFVALRGAAFLLSAADWQIARSWRLEGIPLDLVLAALTDCFAKHALRSRRGRISSLRYCRPAVEAAWQERRELGWAPAAAALPAPELGVTDRLWALAAALPADLPDRERRAAAIRALEGDPEEIEIALARLDADWLAAAEANLSPSQRAELEAALARSLGAVRSRFDPEELAALHARLLRQALRRQLGLPELSLFASFS